MRIFAGCVVVSVCIAAYRYSQPQPRLVDGLRSCANVEEVESALLKCTRDVVLEQLEMVSPTTLLREAATSEIPRAYGDCHPIAHMIGQETYKQSHNLEQTLAQCSNACFDGCLHGALGEAVVEELGVDDPDLDLAHMDTQQIETIGGKFCQGFATMPLCHGIGHILYTLTEDFKASSRVCKNIATGVLLDECMTGVYMQGVGGIANSLVLGTSVPSLAESSDGDFGYPCSMIPRSERQFQHSCYKYLPAYQQVMYAKMNIENPAEKLTRSTRHCETLRMPERSYCFEGMGRYTPFYVAPTGTTTEGFINICANLPKESDKESCMFGRIRIVRSYGKNNEALTYCSAVQSENLRHACFFSFFSYYGLDTVPSEASACSDAPSRPLCASELALYAQELPALRTSDRYRY